MTCPHPSLLWTASVIGGFDRYRCPTCGAFVKRPQERRFDRPLPEGTTVMPNPYGIAVAGGARM